MQFGWIDFSRSERDEILNVLKSLSEPETLDELGIAPIRDGFADLFFPGTSTIQTRAKYFFIVPYALKDLENGPYTTPEKMSEELYRKEKACARNLSKESEETGIIGSSLINQKNWIKRTPSDIYWVGLRRYKIFQYDFSLSEYIHKICKMKKENVKNMGSADDDADAYNTETLNFWNPSLPYPPKKLDSEMSIRLTEEESRFLKEQIISTCGGSMMSHILENGMKDVLECKSFRDLHDSKIIENFPPEIQINYNLALSFSEFVFALRTIFNAIVSKKTNEETKEELSKQNLKQIASIDIQSIAEIKNINQRLENHSSLLQFLKNAKNAMKDNDLKSLKKCIKERERSLKQERAKTNDPGNNDEIKNVPLGYRFANAKRIINDILYPQEA